MRRARCHCSKICRTLLATSAASLLVIQPVVSRAAVRVKANNSSNLNLTASWTGAVVPGYGDTALWNSSVTGANAVLLGGNLTFRGISIVNPGGSVAIGGASTLTLGPGGIDMRRATQDFTLTNLSLVLSHGEQVWAVTNGRSLTVSPGTLVRDGSATLNFLGGGTLPTATFTNDGTGIIGTWASHGASNFIRYATVSGGSIIGYSGGVAAPTAAGVIDTTGTTNYDVAAVGTLGAGASFNTLRYTGTAGTVAGDFSANGLMNAGSGALAFSNTVTIGANRSLVITSPDATRAITISGIISNNAGGSSGLVKSGLGTVTLSGTNAYDGPTMVNAGILIIKNGAALGAPGGTAFVYRADGTNATPTDSTGQLRLDPGGGGGFVLDKTVFIEGSENYGYGGTLLNASGTNAINGNVLLSPLGSRIGVSGGSRLELNGQVIRTNASYNPQLVFNATGRLVANGAIDIGTGQLYAHSGGTNELNAKATLGTLAIQYGNTVVLGVDDALSSNAVVSIGVGSGATTNGGALDLNGHALTIAGLRNEGFHPQNNVTSATPATLTISNSAASAFGSRITGGVAIDKRGAGTQTLFGTNTHTGDTTVYGGRLVVGNRLSLQNSTLNLQINNGAALSNDTSFVLGGLAGSGNLGLTNLAGSAVTLLVGNNGASTVYSGSLDGGGGLTKIGSGELDLTGVNSYASATVVSNGLLSVNGRHFGGAGYTVASGGTLGGTGIIDAAIQVLANGIVAPGNSIGTLTISNNFDLDGILQIELANAAGLAGSSDLLGVNGFFDITNGVVQFVFTGTMTNDHYIFAQYDTFSGGPFLDVQNLPTGYEIQYNYLGSNQIALVIPEPSSWALVVCSVGLLAVAHRRRPR